MPVHAAPLCPAQGTDPELRSNSSLPQPTLWGPELWSQARRACLVSFSFTAVPSRGFPYAERLSTVGLNPRVGQLTRKRAAAHSSRAPSSHRRAILEATQSPAWTAGTGLSVAFRAPPPQAVPRKLLLSPEPLHLEGWERETVRPSEGTSRNCGGETDFEERTTQRRPRGIYISCVWLSVRQAEGRADSQRPGQESARLRTVPRPVSLQGVVPWVGFRPPSLLGPTPLCVPLHLWIPQPFQNFYKESVCK